MKIKMVRGHLVSFFGKDFDLQPPVISFKHGYIWVGGEHGPCYAHLSGNARLRKLGLALVKATKPKRKRK